jgi:hypothetical protein
MYKTIVTYITNCYLNSNSSSCTARLILHQLRWLDYIAQPEVLTGKLIEASILYNIDKVHHANFLSIDYSDYSSYYST